mgnify:CR=1 FL=1
MKTSAMMPACTEGTSGGLVISSTGRVLSHLTTDAIGSLDAPRGFQVRARTTGNAVAGSVARRLLHVLAGPAVDAGASPRTFRVLAGRAGSDGEPAEGEGAPRTSVKFYLVAMLFILFDIEVIFLFPWAVVYKDMLATNAPLIFGSMISFIGILLVGYIYAVKKKAFDWKR